MRNNLQNHIRMFGPDGRFTFHAGLDLVAAAKISCEAVKRSTLHPFQPGDRVVIRGTTTELVIEQVLGVMVVLTSYGHGTVAEFKAEQPPHGRYSYGRIKVYQGHLMLVEWL
jgi:hypothetical protein